MKKFLIILLFLIIIFYYIIYKTEYFKNNISNIKTTIKIIDKNNFNDYKKELDELYSKCVYSDNIICTDFKLNTNNSKVFVLINDNKIIGSLQIDNFDHLKKQFYIKHLGAIHNKNGLYLTYLCGNNNYKGITKPLFEEVDKYASNNGFEYILLEAKTEWRVNYYKKFGYTNIKSNLTSMIKYIK
jgi:hypothetical protein